MSKSSITILSFSSDLHVDAVTQSYIAYTHTNTHIIIMIIIIVIS